VSRGPAAGPADAGGRSGAGRRPRLGAATRPYPGETANGDGWAASWDGDACRLTVVDGLGHGPMAAAATRAALDALAARPTYAGVGNVEARLWPAGPAGPATRPIAYRGIVGAVLPTLRPAEFALAEDWLLVLHTDGLSARLVLEPGSAGAGLEPQALAEALLSRWGRATDDATVVVVAAG